MLEGATIFHHCVRGGCTVGERVQHANPESHKQLTKTDRAVKKLTLDFFKVISVRFKKKTFHKCRKHLYSSYGACKTVCKQRSLCCDKRSQAHHLQFTKKKFQRKLCLWGVNKVIKIELTAAIASDATWWVDASNNAACFEGRQIGLLRCGSVLRGSCHDFGSQHAVCAEILLKLLIRLLFASRLSPFSNHYFPE